MTNTENVLGELKFAPPPPLGTDGFFVAAAAAGEALPDGSVWVSWPPSEADLEAWCDATRDAALRHFQETHELETIVIALCDPGPEVASKGIPLGRILLASNLSHLVGSGADKDALSEMLVGALQAMGALAMVFVTDAYVRSPPPGADLAVATAAADRGDFSRFIRTEACIIQTETLHGRSTFAQASYTRNRAGEVDAVAEPIKGDATRTEGRLTNFLRCRVPQDQMN